MKEFVRAALRGTKDLEQAFAELLEANETLEEETIWLKSVVEMQKETVSRLKKRVDPELESKYEDLLDKYDALEEENQELRDRVNLLKGADLKDLANAVSAFAEWRESGYLTSSPETFEVVSNQLWAEVASHVRSITQTEPPNPCSREEGDRKDRI